MKSPLVYIIVLNWNGLDLTVACIESLKKCDYDNYRLLVIDNCSSDGSDAALKPAYPWLTIIENDRNIGFTGANNIGMRYALEQGAEFVWLLNNDTEVAPDCLSLLVDELTHFENVGMISPILYYFDDPNRVQFCGSYLDRSTFFLVYPENKVTAPESCFVTGDSVCLWGTALLLKRSLIEHVGYLNDNYFAYWEDTEYSMRVLEAGFQGRVCTAAALYHKMPSPGNLPPRSRPHATYLMLRNRYLLYSSCLTGVRFRKFLGDFFAEFIVELGYAERLGDKTRVAACFLALRDALRGKGGPVPILEGRCVGWLCVAVARTVAWHPYLLAHLVRGDLSLMIKKGLAAFFGARQSRKRSAEISEHK